MIYSDISCPILKSFWFLNSAVEAAGGKALPCVVNVREEEQIADAVEKAVQKFGGMLICVH